MVRFGKFGLALVLLAWAPQAAQAQTLEEALAHAYRNSPDLESQRATLRGLDENVNQALAGWRPTVSLSYGHSRQTQSTQYKNGLETVDGAIPRNAGATVSQPVWNGSAGPATDSAERRVLQGRAGLIQQEQLVLQNAAQSYLDVLRNLNTLTEVAQAEARLASAEARLDRARNQLDSSRGGFLRNIGLMPETLRFPTDPPVVPTDQAAVLSAADAAPTVLAAQHAVDAAQSDVAAAEGRLLPTLSLQGSRSRGRDVSELTQQSDVRSIGLQLNIPLYQAGAEYAGVRERKQQVGRAKADLDVARRQARLTAVQALSRLASARSDIRSFEAAVRTNEIALEGVQAEFQDVGSRTLIEVLNARQELFEARINLLTAQTEEAAARFAVRAATGTLTAQALDLPVEIYRPERHYDDARGRWIGLGD
jgi:outer membrane protein